MRRFDGLHAIVTGGTGGIGGAISTLLAGEGAHVTATSWSKDEISARSTEKEFEGIALAMLDVGDLAAVNRFAEELKQIDILINCAGTTSRGPAAFEENEFLRVVDINLTGTMRVSRACLPQLTKTKGTVVNIASVMSYYGSGTAPGYAASKGGVSQLTKSLAIAWAPLGIRVNAIAPGWIETPLTRAVIKTTDPALYQRVIERTPMRRWGEPDYIARAVAFLCSADAEFVTGAIIPVDGGYMAV